MDQGKEKENSSFFTVINVKKDGPKKEKRKRKEREREEKST